MAEHRSFNDVFAKPILINLDRRQDRLEQFHKQASDLGISYERLSAIALDDPVAGCKASHLMALTKYDTETVFVFEDDSVFIEDFNSKFGQAMENLPDDWDMVYLGAHIVDTQRVNDYWLRSTVCSSTHAYGIKADVRSALVETANNYDGHIDVAYSKLHRKIKAYIARPTLVYQGASYSDIRGEEVDYKGLYFR